MATTEVSYPSTPSPSRGNILWKFSSNTANLYHLIVEPVINSVKYPPQICQADPDGFYYFDGKEIITDVIALRTGTYYPSGTFAFVRKSALEFVFSLNIYEVTESGSTLADTYPTTADATGTACTVIESVAGVNSAYYDGLSSYKLATGSKLFHTSAPRTGVIVKLTDNYYLHHWSASTLNCDTLRVTAYNQAGTQINTYDYSIAGIAGLISMTVGPAQLNNGHANMITSSCAYYTVLVRGNGFDTSETFRFNVDSETNSTNMRLWWIGSMGCWEAYTFNDFIQQVRKQSTTTLKKRLPRVTGNNLRGVGRIATEGDTLTYVTSDRHIYSYIAWVNSLKETPLAFVQENSTGDLISIEITGKFEQIINDWRLALPTVDVEFIYSNSTNLLRN